MEDIDVLDSVKASIAEEKIIEETRNIGAGQMIWKRMALCQKIASAVEADFVTTPRAHKDIPSDYLNELQEAFTIFDEKSTGSISANVLGDILRSLGQNPSEEYVQKVFTQIDQDGSGTINFVEFADFISSVETATMSSLESAFKVIDENGNGKLDIHELHNVLLKLGEKPTQKQLEYMMQSAGQPVNGEVDFAKFVKLMNGDFS